MPSAVVVESANTRRDAAVAIEALRLIDKKVCTCCEHTEHDLDKSGVNWLLFSLVAVAKCRRCGQDCCNLRCDELPANPDGRGYGNVKRFGRR